MGKNIVLCLDGTSNRVRPGHQTNVLKLFEVLDVSDRAVQVGYYDPGVGTFSSPAAWTPAAQAVSRWGGLAFGAGIRQNLAEAYEFLTSVYEDGDEIFVFGFSRGAYTARALTGLLELIGILKHDAANLIPYAIGDYARRSKGGGDKLAVYWETLREYARLFGHKVGSKRNRTSHAPVEFLGIWDTVRAVGTLRGPLYWPFTSQLPHVRTVRHALAIDEWRRHYRPLLVWPTSSDHLIRTSQDIQQVWFAGVHSNVGGGIPPREDGSQLSRPALKWMLDEAVTAGLKVHPGRYKKAAQVELRDALSPVHSMNKAWAVLGPGRRRLPDNALIHTSVTDRTDHDPDYRRKLPSSFEVVDTNWQTPIKPSPVSDEPA